METQYSGYDIVWDDSSLSFAIYKDKVIVKKLIKILEVCKKWIDQKNKQKFKRIPILYQFNYKKGMEKGEATSVVGDDEGVDVWVASADKLSRCKASVNDVWLDTFDNRKILEEIAEKEDKKREIQREINALSNSASRLTIDMMLEEK